MPLRGVTKTPHRGSQDCIFLLMWHQKVRKLNQRLQKEKKMCHLLVQGSTGVKIQTGHVDFADMTWCSHLLHIEELSLTQWNHRLWNITWVCSRNKVRITKEIHKFWWTWLMLFLQLPLDYSLWMIKSSLAKLLNFKKSLLNWKQCQISAILEASNTLTLALY